MDHQNHKAKSARNEDFIREVFGDYVSSPTPYLDWVVTAIFYTAVHKVDELLAHENIHPPDHAARRRQVSDHKELRPIFADYRFLEDKSRQSRYEDCQFEARSVNSWAINKLGKVKRHIDTRIEKTKTT